MAKKNSGGEKPADPPKEPEKAKEPVPAEPPKEKKKAKEPDSEPALPNVKLSALDDALLSMVRGEAAKFLQDNAADVKELGEDVVTAILAQQILATMPSIPKLDEKASLAMSAAVQEILATRSTVFAVIAKAERENATRVQRVRGNASTIAGRIAGGTFTLVAGAALRMLIGG